MNNITYMLRTRVDKPKGTPTHYCCYAWLALTTEHFYKQQ